MPQLPGRRRSDLHGTPRAAQPVGGGGAPVGVDDEAGRAGPPSGGDEVVVAEGQVGGKRASTRRARCRPPASPAGAVELVGRRRLDDPDRAARRPARPSASRIEARSVSGGVVPGPVGVPVPVVDPPASSGTLTRSVPGPLPRWSVDERLQGLGVDGAAGQACRPGGGHDRRRQVGVGRDHHAVAGQASRSGQVVAVSSVVLEEHVAGSSRFPTCTGRVRGSSTTPSTAGPGVGGRRRGVGRREVYSTPGSGGNRRATWTPEAGVDALGGGQPAPVRRVGRRQAAAVSAADAHPAPASPHITQPRPPRASGGPWRSIVRNAARSRAPSTLAP